MWTEQLVANELYLITLCRQRLCDRYIQQWFGIISQRSSCILHKDLHVSYLFFLNSYKYIERAFLCMCSLNTCRLLDVYFVCTYNSAFIIIIFVLYPHRL